VLYERFLHGKRKWKSPFIEKSFFCSTRALPPPIHLNFTICRGSIQRNQSSLVFLFFPSFFLFKIINDGTGVCKHCLTCGSLLRKREHPLRLLRRYPPESFGANNDICFIHTLKFDHLFRVSVSWDASLFITKYSLSHLIHFIGNNPLHC